MTEKGHSQTRTPVRDAGTLSVVAPSKRGRERPAPTRAADPLATLQRSLGNRAMRRLLQRDPKDKGELVTHLEGLVAAIPGTAAPGAAVVLKDPLPKAVNELQAAAKAAGKGGQEQAREAPEGALRRAQGQRAEAAATGSPSSTSAPAFSGPGARPTTRPRRRRRCSRPFTPTSASSGGP